MSLDHEPNPPPARSHPTIFYVALSRVGSARWEAGSEAYRNQHVAEWLQKAAARGKKTIEIWGRYCKLAEFPVEKAT